MTTQDYRTRSPLRIFLSYFKPHRRLFALDMTCAFLIACIDLASPASLARRRARPSGGRDAGDSIARRLGGASARPPHQKNQTGRRGGAAAPQLLTRDASFIPATANEKRERGSPSPFPGVPFFPPFGVVVGDIPDAFQLHGFHQPPPDIPLFHRSIPQQRPVEHIRGRVEEIPVCRCVAPPTQRYEVHGMVCPTFPARLDVMDLQSIRRIAQSAPETIPFVYRPPGLVVNAGTHIPFHVFVPSFLPSRGTTGHHGKARAGASPLCITLAAVIYWECARGHDRDFRCRCRSPALSQCITNPA